MEYPSLDKPTAGAFRFNTDRSQLEIYDGNQWTGVLATSPENETGGTRGLFCGGGSPYAVDYINVDTTGNAVDFGDPSPNVGYAAAVSSRTRAVLGGGNPGTDTIQYVQIATTGNFSDSGGNLSASRWAATGISNGTRGIFCGGNESPGRVNTLEYVTIAALGNAVDFGDMATIERDQGSCASPTRGVLAGGYDTDPVAGSIVNMIYYVTVSTTGNTSDFGDLTQARMGLGGGSNAVRGIFAGGYSTINTMDYITIASLGNAIEFGDLIYDQFRGGSCTSSTRFVYGGGNNTPDRTNIQYVNIATTGNSTLFGTLSAERVDIQGGGCSNGHGGL